MKKTNEEYNNLIELLKKALEFYADENNYSIEIYIEDNDVTKNTKSPSMVALDGGTQAKFALEKIATFQDDRDEQEKEFVKNMISAIESDANQDTVLGLIEEYKKQTDG